MVAHAKPPRKPLHLRVDRLPTPIGEALVAVDPDGRLRALDWHDHESRLHRLLRIRYGSPVIGTGAAPPALRRSLVAYFDGDLDAIVAIPCETGGTAFQSQVWTALREIPAGRTLSYGALAAGLGRPQAVRAVGAANGANPISVVIPCHRLIGADGHLTGYGGGLHRKRWLLAHEGALQHQLT